MAIAARLKDGRSWSVSAKGITQISRRYLVQRESIPEGTDAEELAAVTGLPSIGTAHESNENLIVTGYKFAEGTEGGKKLVVVDVEYTLTEQEWEGGTATTAADAVEQWGWNSGSVSRDLSTDAVTGETILNSAGDPFDSVPQVDRPAPVFAKVLKSKSRKSGWVDLYGCVNDAAVTIGGYTFAEAQLRVTAVNEERLWNDAFGFKYRYTVNLQAMSNKVKLEQTDEETEIGWDVAIVDQGCYGNDPDEGGAGKYRFTEADTDGNQIPVTLPVLMDGGGGKLEGASPTPYITRRAAYPRAAIPSAFYSEPA